MFISQFFTKYDESITQSLNIDPLGMTMIWSQLGQRIFRSRVSSISNDVRNYTISLLHHYVIKLVVEKEPVLSKSLQRLYENVDSLAFKQACLIYLENIFVFSMLDAEQLGYGTSDAAIQQYSVDTRGILGSSKARSKMQQDQFNPTLFFTKESKGQLLVRQLTLGVSGRYKTPFLEMKFFDKEFCYHLPEETANKWQQTKDFIDGNLKLNTLVNDLVKHLLAIVKQDDPMPRNDWSNIPQDIKNNYVECFASPSVIGKQSKDFWLRITELNQKAAGSLYKAITNEPSVNEHRLQSTVQQYFESAIKEQSIEEEKKKLQDICDVEPLLAECDFLFTLLMSKATQSRRELYEAYKGEDNERDVNSIIQLAAELQDRSDIINLFQGIAKERYLSLLKLAKLNSQPTQQNMDNLVDSLLQYHQKIMNHRGQSAWVEINKQDGYRCNIKQLTADSRSYQSWNNRYYIDQFKNLIYGLEGVSLEKNNAENKSSEGRIND